MNGRLLLTLAAAVAMASAATKSYSITLLQPTVVGNTELKAGSYKVDVTDQKAVIHSGKISSEVPVHVEESTAKFANSSVVLSTDNGKHKLQEIHLGGTKTRLIVGESSGASSGQ